MFTYERRKDRKDLRERDDGGYEAFDDELAVRRMYQTATRKNYWTGILRDGAQRSKGTKMRKLVADI